MRIIGAVQNNNMDISAAGIRTFSAPPEFMFFWPSLPVEQFEIFWYPSASVIGWLDAG